MENERDEKKGNGIFLGIVGVATLIVAIIGASFAYFSAQAASANSAIDLTAYEFNASLVMEPVYVPTETLIPVFPMGTVANVDEPNNKNLAYAINKAQNKCVDSQGHAICALYKVQLTNNGTTDLQLKGSIVTTENNAGTMDDATPFQNLQYREVTKADAESDYVVGDTATALATTAGASVDIDSSAFTVTSGATVTRYFVIYLNDIDDDQNNEMGASFKGQVVFTSQGTNSNRLTGTFTVSGN